MTVPRWLRALVVTVGIFGGTLVLVVGFLVWDNPAPSVPAIASSDAASAARPYLIKLHARWCPVCMVTKDEWASVQASYQGRVRFVVFDFTTEGTTEASRAQASQLGLDAIFDDYAGSTGTVLIVDGVTKEITQALHGNLELAEYRTAIDAALAVR